jgi:hypothetical protein
MAIEQGTKGNEVSPTHCLPRKVLATCEQSKAMVEGVEEEAKSECLVVMTRIGTLSRGESRLTCLRCDSVKAVATSTNDPEGI